jgi:hypothetical protein
MFKKILKLLFSKKIKAEQVKNKCCTPDDYLRNYSRCCTPDEVI